MGTYLFISDEVGGLVNLPTGEFCSKKITNKIVQQIQDPLVLASNALPDWCEKLTKNCPMLFSFDTRQLYFSCTAFGCSRYDFEILYLKSISFSCKNVLETSTFSEDFQVSSGVTGEHEFHYNITCLQLDSKTGTSTLQGSKYIY